jgi:hypothetical protein
MGRQVHAEHAPLQEPLLAPICRRLAFIYLLGIMSVAIFLGLRLGLH